MSKTAAINIRIDSTIKTQAEHHRTGSHADLFQPILWDRLFLLVFCTDALHMASFHHRTQKRSPLLPCSTRAQRRALFIVFCYAVSIFPWKSSRASGLMVM